VLVEGVGYAFKVHFLEKVKKSVKIIIINIDTAKKKIEFSLS